MISYDQHFHEKTSFAGFLISSVLYGTQGFSHPYFRLSVLTLQKTWFILGIVVMLFFQYMAALLNPIHRRGKRIKWGVVSYTTLMFSVVTAFTTSSLRSVSFIDNRKFSGVEGIAPPGPLGYQTSIDSGAPSLATGFLFLLSGWLADGLLARPFFNPAFALLGV